MSLAMAGARFLAPKDQFGERLIQTASALKVKGARIFDLAIALTALDNGASEIWTHDSGFIRVAGYVCMTHCSNHLVQPAWRRAMR